VTAETVEDLLVYAGHQCASRRVSFPVTRLRKLVQRAYREGGPEAARNAVDVDTDSRARQSYDDALAFRTVTGYYDPTGADAARNLDAANVAEKLRERWAGVRHEFA
jgi:hypothetical protein